MLQRSGERETRAEMYGRAKRTLLRTNPADGRSTTNVHTAPTRAKTAASRPCRARGVPMPISVRIKRPRPSAKRCRAPNRCLEVANQQQPEVRPRQQARTSQLGGVKTRRTALPQTRRSRAVEHLIQPLVEGCPPVTGNSLVAIHNPGVRAPSLRRPMAMPECSTRDRPCRSLWVSKPRTASLGGQARHGRTIRSSTLRMMSSQAGENH
jgi:hypothetical protein